MSKQKVCFRKYLSYSKIVIIKAQRRNLSFVFGVCIRNIIDYLWKKQHISSCWHLCACRTLHLQQRKNPKLYVSFVKLTKWLYVKPLIGVPCTDSYANLLQLLRLYPCTLIFTAEFLYFIFANEPTWRVAFIVDTS